MRMISHQSWGEAGEAETGLVQEHRTNPAQTRRRVHTRAGSVVAALIHLLNQAGIKRCEGVISLLKNFHPRSDLDHVTATRDSEMKLTRFVKQAHANTKADGPGRVLGPKAMWFVYPFFSVHMLAFGLSGFLIAYMADAPDIMFLYIHGGIAIFVYIVFYLVIFGFDAVSWMVVNAALGIIGIYAQIGWILERFGKRIEDFPWQVHVVPFTYYVLYTFLLRQLLIDATRSRDNPQRRAMVETGYVVASLLVYGVMLWRGQAAG
ncbi:MAG: hypothetical protein ABIO38_02350 [Luteimonas sp.]